MCPLPVPRVGRQASALGGWHLTGGHSYRMRPRDGVRRRTSPRQFPKLMGLTQNPKTRLKIVTAVVVIVE